MKEIKEYLNESSEWNPSLDSHKVAYNNFVKWYDKTLNRLNKEEILDLLNGAIKEIEDDSLDIIK